MPRPGALLGCMGFLRMVSSGRHGDCWIDWVGIIVVHGYVLETLMRYFMVLRKWVGSLVVRIVCVLLGIVLKGVVCLIWGYVGHAYTWSNKQSGLRNIQERLDRGLATELWQTRFPLARVTHLPKLLSDHCPLWIEWEVSPLSVGDSFSAYVDLGGGCI
ncbi:hypothetical protein ACS0TY_006230 [Phlomoides rotata]